MAKSENLLRRAIRKENQTLFDQELLKTGQRESPRHRLLEPRKSHLYRLMLLSKASLSIDRCARCGSRGADPGRDTAGMMHVSIPRSRRVERRGMYKHQHVDAGGQQCLISGFVLSCVLCLCVFDFIFCWGCPSCIFDRRLLRSAHSVPAWDCRSLFLSLLMFHLLPQLGAWGFQTLWRSSLVDLITVKVDLFLLPSVS